MHNYTLIAYKPDSTDYCRGCRMASYSSDHILLCSTNQEEIADKWAEIEEKEMKVNETGYEITILIDGFSYSYSTNYAEDDLEEARNTAYKELVDRKDAESLRRTYESDARKEQARQNAVAKKTAQEADEKERKELADRTEYERLRQKYRE